MKIKISDLVNKVINREEMPKEVLFDGHIYKWCNDIGDYRRDGWSSCLIIRDIFNNLNRYGSLYNMLFEDVEIIEEDKKIKKLDEYEYDTANEILIIRKINEIIDYLEENKKCLI